jgi:hypothetical protein
MVQAPVVAKTLLDSPSQGMDAESITYSMSNLGQSKRFNRVLKAILDYLIVVPGLTVGVSWV